MTNEEKLEEAIETKMDAKLQEWKADLERRKAQLKGATAETEVKLRTKAIELDGKVDTLQSKLASAKDSAGDTWDDVKEDVVSAFNSLKAGIDDMYNDMKK